MIRFVDIRGQDIGHRFAFWDTIRQEFCTFSGCQAWDDADDFARDYRSHGQEFFGGLERFTGLMPAWASQPATDAELMSPDEPAESQPQDADTVRDAERYRWLAKEHGWWLLKHFPAQSPYVDASEVIDAAIDAARGA
ncbi:MAG TPA: hypothetical protein VIN03_09465 [Roseateles sp.]